MPAPDVHTAARGRPLPAALFWIGVVLAPIAAGLLLVAKSNGTLRIAAVLAVLSVVLIGLSVALRGDAETVRQELEETLFDELDELHKGLRNDIETAARTTHRAFSEKLQLLQNQVEVLRGQLEKARAELERRGPAVPERAADFARHGEPAGHGTVGHQPNDAAAAAQPSRPA
ncbi:MAG TPA: hypothetical protein VFX61_02085, partial [Micromonosporaceae bacterium]|nr:hypothetical protein [Micromonosporaceae bacterium]